MYVVVVSGFSVWPMVSECGENPFSRASSAIHGEGADGAVGEESATGENS